MYPANLVISGRSPVGGVDIWAEEIAEIIGRSFQAFEPRQQKWDAEYGYKQRNIDIARNSDIVHVIVADTYPETYVGRRFGACYHCLKHYPYEAPPGHVKSGGCWTGYKAIEFGNQAEWHIIAND